MAEPNAIVAVSVVCEDRTATTFRSQHRVVGSMTGTPDQELPLGAIARWIRANRSHPSACLRWADDEVHETLFLDFVVEVHEAYRERNRG